MAKRKEKRQMKGRRLKAWRNMKKKERQRKINTGRFRRYERRGKIKV